MRCGCCNRRLTDYESTLRSESTGEFLDTCMKCLKGLQIAVVGNPELKHKDEPDIEDLADEDYYDDFQDIPVDFGQNSRSED